MTSPTTPTTSIAEVRLSCGRNYLTVAGVIVAMEGDSCRDGSMPESVLPPIPPSELEAATIGGNPVKGLPREVVRFFRGDNWTAPMLEWAAEKINHAVGLEIGAAQEAMRRSTEQIERRRLEGMARAAVNCGPHSGCWLAKRLLEDKDRQ